MVKTAANIAQTVEFIRQLHWDILRVSKQYRSDFEKLEFDLKEIAKKPESSFSSTTNRTSALRTAQLDCQRKFKELRAIKRLIEEKKLWRTMRYQPFFPLVNLDDKEARDALLLRLKNDFKLAKQTLKEERLLNATPTDWHRWRDAQTMLDVFKQLSDESLTPRDFAKLIAEAKRSAGSLDDLVGRFCRKWDITVPIPPVANLSESLEIFTGPYAQPVRKQNWDSVTDTVTLVLFKHVGREIAAEFAWGALHTHLPVRTDGQTSPYKPALNGVSARVVSEDEIELKIVLPVDRKTLTDAILTVCPKFSLRLRRKSWESMFQVERMWLKGKTLQQIAEEISTDPKGDPRDVAKVQHRRYRKYLRRFFPNVEDSKF